MDVKIEPSWKRKLQSEFEQPYFEALVKFVKQEYQNAKTLPNAPKIYPPGSLIFNAFDKCPFENVKVVLLGQDPYHGEGQANGMCFAVNEGVPFPPSLQNIFQELHDDLGKPIPTSGTLLNWAKQGVLLLNATLTVREGQPGSHQNKGWEIFTDKVIRIISQEKNHVVFLLWGAYAQKKEILIDASKHCILKAAHPSPLSAHKGFFGCKHFSKANQYLLQHGKQPIDW
ncbi:MAG: uracil-DNA glycosylase [Cytophagales bacterium]|nr:uracil-DNA glycosylase [Cytophagales bacterium]MDW8383949.1 uracil-DNA glycosylase [Flammeovirgaceae bacterium]